MIISAISKTFVAGSVLAALSLARPAWSDDKPVLNVLGQATDAGAIQKNKEQPFFASLAAKFRLPFTIQYVPLDQSGIAEADQLNALQSGRVQIASLRISQAGTSAPELLGMDLLGMNRDFKAGRRATDAYLPALDAALQRHYGLKLFGVWPYGPQFLFCRDPVRNLAELKGRKVRVYDSDLTKFVASAGGTPVRLAFAATRQALAQNELDCAVSSPASAASAGWTELARYVVPISFQLGINAYAMSLPSWTGLPEQQQRHLGSAIGTFIDGLWTYSRQLNANAVDCKSCSTQRPRLIEVPVDRVDRRLMQSGLQHVSFPTWAATCDQIHSACSTDWKRSVGRIVGIK